jgi:hypothetical protein
LTTKRAPDRARRKRRRGSERGDFFDIMSSLNVLAFTLPFALCGGGFIQRQIKFLCNCCDAAPAGTWRVSVWRAARLHAYYPGVTAQYALK